MSPRIAFTLALAMAVATADPLMAQATRRGGGQSGQDSGQSTGGRATPRDSGRSNQGSGSSDNTRGRSGGSTTAAGSGSTSSDGGNQGARRRGDGSGQTGAPVVRGDDGGDRGATRSRGDDSGEPGRGRAVPRRPGSTTPPVIVTPGYWGGYYPWGYGGFGLGGYYGGLYDPWYDPWYDGPYADYGYRNGYEGSLRLKMKPRQAAVYVDGYYAGIIDDYDGIFQKLELDAGPHRIEVRDEGYAPLMFEVRIQPDRKVTYKGELQPLP